MTITATVTDPAGNTGTGSATVEVTAPPSGPVAVGPDVPASHVPHPPEFTNRIL